MEFSWRKRVESEKLDLYCAVMKALVSVSLAAAALGAWFAAAHTQQSAHNGPLTIDQLIDIRHPSNPMWSPDGQHVVFVWDRAGVSKVFVADAAGGAAPRELREAGTSLAGAFWSADKKALMIARGGDLWRVPIDGSAASAVWTTPASESAIVPSPDGARVAFVRSSAAPSSGPADAASSNTRRGSRGGAGGGDLVVRSLADGRETVVLRDAARGIGGLGWSPDGADAGVQRRRTRRFVTSRRRIIRASKIIYTITENVPGRDQRRRVGRRRAENRSACSADSAAAAGSTRAISWSIARRPTSSAARRRSSTSAAASRRWCTRTSKRNSGA